MAVRRYINLDGQVFRPPKPPALPHDPGPDVDQAKLNAVTARMQDASDLLARAIAENTPQLLSSSEDGQLAAAVETAEAFEERVRGSLQPQAWRELYAQAQRDLDRALAETHRAHREADRLVTSRWWRLFSGGRATGLLLAFVAFAVAGAVVTFAWLRATGAFLR